MLSDCNWVNQAQLKQPQSLYSATFGDLLINLSETIVHACLNN